MTYDLRYIAYPAAEGPGYGDIRVFLLVRFENAAPAEFDTWRDGFRAKALAKSISPQTWDRVMGRLEGLKDVTSVQRDLSTH